MIYHNQNKDHYPEQSARERAACTKRFVEISGPKYLDRPGVVERHTATYSTLTASNGASWTVRREDLSYASWFILRSAEVGESVVVKVRCDETAGKR